MNLKYNIMNLLIDFNKILQFQLDYNGITWNICRLLKYVISKK